MPSRAAPRAAPSASAAGVGSASSITAAHRPAERPGPDALLARLQLRHLHCLLAVADCGHLGRAAQQLCITQPAVSKTLNELEGLVGLKLFDRGRHGARPTAEAEAVLPHARQTLQALRATVEQLAPAQGGRVLQLGVLPTVAPALLPPVLVDWAGGRAPATLRIHTGRNAPLLEQLRRGELDLVIGRLSEPEAMAGLVFEHLYAEPLVLVARAGHPLWSNGKATAAGRPATPPARSHAAPPVAAFLAHPLVLPLPGTLIRQVADAYLSRHGLLPGRGLVETLDGLLALALVEEADALWITPVGAASRALRGGTVRRWPGGITPEEPIGLITRSGAAATPALRALRVRLRSEAARQRSASDAPGA